MSGHEAFFRAMFVGGVLLLVVAIFKANWVAAAWACVSLLGSSFSVASDVAKRRADR